MSRETELAFLHKIKNGLCGQERLEVAQHNCDLSFIKNIFNSAKSNADENSFPDFLFPDGAIEHFSIDGSKEKNGKGSSFRAEQKRIDEEAEKEIAKFCDDFRKSEFQPGALNSLNASNTYDCFTYEGFLISFKKHFVDHINSLRKQNGNYKAMVFLVEDKGPRLCLWKGEQISAFYCISYDKPLLQFLSRFSQEVNYLIYYVADTIEIIDLSKLQELINTAKGDLDVRAGNLVEAKLMITLDLSKFE